MENSLVLHFLITLKRGPECDKFVNFFSVHWSCEVLKSCFFFTNIIIVEMLSSLERIQSTLIIGGAPRVSLESRATRVLRPLSYFSLKLETTRSLLATPLLFVLWRGQTSRQIDWNSISGVGGLLLRRIAREFLKWCSISLLTPFNRMKGSTGNCLCVP